MKRKILKILLILILLITLTLTNFLLVGQSVVQALYEELESQNITTNVKEVEFDVYLKNGDQKVHSKQSQIALEEILYINLNVKNKGTLNNAKINIENSNFKILKDKVQNTYVKNINENTNEIELNTIVYGNNITIELPIKFNKQETFEAEYFTKENSIKLSGTYKDTNEQAVNGELKTRILWTQDVDVNISQNIEKYIDLGESGILLQQNIQSEIPDNILPRENENISVNVPVFGIEKPESVIVLLNGEKLTQDKVIYDIQTGKLEIKNQNTLNAENKVTWGTGKNEYKVIYTYNKSVGIENRTIELNATLNTKMYTKENIQKQDVQTVEISKIGNVVSIQKSSTNSIYKGYMYANVPNETIFEENNLIEISNINLNKNIEITKNKDEFVNQTSQRFDVSNNVLFKSTKINKNDLIKVLGLSGEIVIKDGNANILATMNNNSETDENGNIVVNYEGEVNNIVITMTNPENEGKLNINNTRAIKGNTGYTKEQLKSYITLNTSTKVISDSEEIAESVITLNDTKTEGKIEITNSNLSTLQNNENIQLLATLKSNNEQFDLYKNPTVEIVIPKELSVKVKNITQLNAQSELNITNPKLSTNENGEQVINITFSGEQTTFENNINEGIQVSITLDIVIDKNTPSKKSEIKMNYTNENRQGENLTTSVPISLNSKYGVLLLNQLNGFNANNDLIESVDDKLKTGILDINGEEKQAIQNISIINNYESDITDISLIGKMPVIGQETINGQTLKATFESNLLEAVNVQGKTCKIYYSEDANSSKDSDTWKENIEDITKAKSFKITIEDNKLEPGQVLNVSSKIKIPGGLEEEQQTYINTLLEYSYLGDTIKTNSNIMLKNTKANMVEDTQTPEWIETTDNISIQLIEKTGGHYLTEGQEVYEGQGIQYIIKIKNTGTESINNLKIQATNTNAIYFDAVKHDYVHGEVTGELTKIEENEALKEKQFVLETLQAGEEKEFSYQISVKEVEGNEQTTEGEINITGDNIETKTVQTKQVKIKQGEVKLTLENDFFEEIDIFSKEGLPIVMNVKNITDGLLKDIIVELPVPEELNFSTDQILITEEDKYEFIEYKNNIAKFKIAQLEKGEKIQLYTQLMAKSIPADKLSVTTDFFFNATINDNKYISNNIVKQIYQSEPMISAVQTSNLQKDTLENEDKLTFTFTIKNEGVIAGRLFINDMVPDGLVVQDSYILQQGNKTQLEVISNNVNTNITAEPGETITWVINTIVNTEIIESDTVTNYATITGTHTNIKTNEITYKVKGKENPENPNEDKTYSISGEIWNDANENALKEPVEERLSDMIVMLINEETGEIAKDKDGNEMSIVTQYNGYYEFNNLLPNKYMVIVKYDTAKYQVTEYQKEGIDQSSNSDFIVKNIKLNGIDMQVAATRTLNLQEKNIQDIDAGFIEGKIFDLRLDKYISRITVQDSNKTKTVNYTNQQLAKVELDAKRISSTNVIIEYKINITNEGEIPGYASELVDYIPNDLDFKSEINKTWYQGTDGNLYTKELANQIINPGETKVITLVLMKKMNQNNVGTIINTAEITKSSNDFLLSDIDSIQANKVEGEDDISTAEVIISIGTGTVIMYTVLIFIIITIIGVGIYLINKTVLKDNEKE